MFMKKATPIFVVDDIEPVVDFWVTRLGFEKVAEVPEGDKLGFLILNKGPVELMYQTRDSIRNDVPAMLDYLGDSAAIVFIEVESIDEVERALVGVPQLIPRRETFYGATELFVRDPAGNIVGFAEMHQK
jgi:catechol 2,3-dioxygenase-like lactoylglutathione lyase family enzyme